LNNYQIIRTLSKEKKISLKEISNRVGITEQGLQKIINNGSGKVSTIELIADVLQVPISIILNNESQENILDDLPRKYKHTRSLDDVTEIDYLHQLLKDKERIISLLEDQLRNCNDKLKGGTNEDLSKVI